MGHVTPPRLFQRQFIVRRLGLATINPRTKFELYVRPLRRHKRQWKCRNKVVWGLGVTQGHRQCLHSIQCVDFVFDFIETMCLSCIGLYRFRVIASCQKSPILTYPPAFDAPVGSYPVRISRISLVSEKKSPWAIVQFCLRDQMFSL